MRLLVVFGLVGALVVGACSGDDDADQGSAATTTTATVPATTTTTAVASTTVPTSTTTEAGCEPGVPPDAAATGGHASEPGLLGDVTVDVVDACRDVVAFVFEPDAPGFTVEYQPGPFVEDASGNPVDVDGSAFLVVRFEPAYSYDFERNVESYTGPREIKPSGQVYVREVQNTGDFEAVMTWVIGLSERAAFLAEVEHNSLSIVIGSPG